MQSETYSPAGQQRLKMQIAALKLHYVLQGLSAIFFIAIMHLQETAQRRLEGAGYRFERKQASRGCCNESFLSKQASKQASSMLAGKQASEEGSKPASQQASEEASSMQAGRPAGKPNIPSSFLQEFPVIRIFGQHLLVVFVHFPCMLDLQQCQKQLMQRYDVSF